jgi:xanthine/uracil permease
MNLADRSPGAVLAIAAFVLCTQILIEIGMWMVSSMVAVVFAMVTAIAFTAFIITWFNSLLGDENWEGVPAELEPEPEPAAERAPASQPASAFRPVLH